MSELVQLVDAERGVAGSHGCRFRIDLGSSLAAACDDDDGDLLRRMPFISVTFSQLRRRRIPTNQSNDLFTSRFNDSLSFLNNDSFIHSFIHSENHQFMSCTSTCNFTFNVNTTSIQLSFIIIHFKLVLILFYCFFFL